MGGASGGSGFPPEMLGVRPPDYDSEKTGGEKYQGNSEKRRTDWIILADEDSKRKEK
jgi:hypothetical protein